MLQLLMQSVIRDKRKAVKVLCNLSVFSGHMTSGLVGLRDTDTNLNSGWIYPDLNYFVIERVNHHPPLPPPTHLTLGSYM